jgi:hypothetical protein
MQAMQVVGDGIGCKTTLEEGQRTGREGRGREERELPGGRGGRERGSYLFPGEVQ